LLKPSSTLIPNPSSLREIAPHYVNLPKSRKVAVVDRKKHTIKGLGETGAAFANYPMALDEADHRLFVITRFPADAGV